MKNLMFTLLVAMGGAALAAPGPRGLGRAIDLPARAQAVRDAGVPAEEVRTALHAAKGKGLGADEAADLLEAEEEEARDGKIDNFGSFVQEKLDEGLRGRELADAIHEEHARQGKGKHGKGKKAKGPDDEHGPPDGKGPDGEHGPPEGKGPDGEHGPPEGKGPDGEHGGGKEGKGKSGKGKAG
ncbi:MAG: hypothetical protein H6735_23295 [Alphaproteobacteria bacterium]|nr:hypothetical protein [Alphaproteobacteria bacterium]